MTTDLMIIDKTKQASIICLGSNINKTDKNMKIIIDFFNKYKLLFKWTIAYFICVWILMLWIFHFNIFDTIHWTKILHMRLHGFVGISFCIIILSILPIYIASCIVILKTKKPILEIPTLKKTTPPETKVESNISKTDKPQTNTPSFPEKMPKEMEAVFLKVRENGNFQHFTTIHNNILNQPETQSIDSASADFPIPTDFDIDVSESSQTTGMPIFTDINFDTDTSKQTNTKQELEEYLFTKNIPVSYDDNILITKGYAIAYHDDPDFWIADEQTWFAANKQKKSPIISLQEMAKKHNIQPILYLATDNIMDLENLKSAWAQDGIKVISNLDELE